jgi:predicted ATPase
MVIPMPSFTGRERELETLGESLEQVLTGSGRVRFITGQAGSGKTALVGYFAARALAADPDLVVAVGRCNAQTGVGDPYLPFREALNMITGDQPSSQQAGEPGAENSRRLQTILVGSVQVLVEVAPELVDVFVPGAKLLGALGRAVAEKTGWVDRLEKLTHSQARAAQAGSLVAERGRIFQQYTAFVQHLSANVPLILFLDDLQWADSASISLLFHLARHIESSRVLILGAYRPNDVAMGRDGERHPLEPVVHELTRYQGDIFVALDEIPEAEGRRFVAGVLDAEPNRLSPAFREALFRRTSGHALFTVELVRTLKEHGHLVRDAAGRWIETPDLDWKALPARVEGVIEERIGRLEESLHETIVIASVQGEKFSAEVNARVQKLNERQAIRQLSSELMRRHHLVTGLGVVRYGSLRLSYYRFAHSLFQQYLYGTLAEAERIYLHHDVGLTLEALFQGQTEEVAADLARHFGQAREPAKAAAYRLQAGNLARRFSANQEATAHLQAGLALLDNLPAGAARVQLELGLQTALGTVLMASEGYASPQVEAALGRARELSRTLGDPPQSMQVLFGLLTFYLARAEMERALAEGRELLQAAQRTGDDGYILACHAFLGATATYLGRYALARQNLEKAVEMYDLERHRDLIRYQSQDPAVAALAYLCWVSWFQGRIQEGLDHGYAALELARKLDHAYSIVFAGSIVAGLEGWLRRWPESQAIAEKTMALAREKRFPAMLANTMIHHGNALAHQGQLEEGIAEIKKGLSMWESTGASIALPAGRARLAEAYLLAGRQAEGLEALEGSLCCPEQACWLPEQLRFQAELLLLVPGAEEEAEDVLRQALELARNQQSHSFSLRAATSLARLLAQQGRAGEGRSLLAAAYEGFEATPDMPDVADARALLHSL